VTHERRVFLDTRKHKLDTGNFSLPEDIKHYLFSVLRIKEGDDVLVGDSTYSPHHISSLQEQPFEILPTIYTTKVTSEQTLRILSTVNTEEYPQAVTCVAPALAKGDTNDIIIEKSIELGTSHIAIWQAARSIPSIKNENEIQKKLQRWRKIAQSAAQQSGRAFIPSVTFFSSATQLLQYLISQSKNLSHSVLLCSLNPNAVPVRNLSERLPFKRDEIRSFAIIIGPEGDFSTEEETFFLNGGAIQISLGERRLKVDTAAISAMAMLDTLFSMPRKDYSR